MEQHIPRKIAEYKSSLGFYIAVFAVAVVWVSIGVEQAYSKIVTVFFDPSQWLSTATLLVVSMIFPVIIISYNWKHQVTFTEPSWDFRIREIEFFEYEKIIKEYERAYSFLVARIDYPILVLLVITCITSIFFPLAFPLTYALLTVGPFVFAGLILIAIFLLAMFVFRATPNSATPFFHTYPTKPFKNIVNRMWDTIGISWAGIRLNIGEYEGYFLIREVKATGRIEGIESVARIEIVPEDDGSFSAFSVLQLEPVDGTKIITLESGVPSLEMLDLNTLVKQTLLAYIEEKGLNEILEELMIDLGIPISE
jgi:hypothetical protein